MLASYMIFPVSVILNNINRPLCIVSNTTTASEVLVQQNKKHMRLILFNISFALFTVVGYGQNYQPVDNGSSVKFSIKNFALNVIGDFKGLAGAIRFNATDPGSASFNVSVDAFTINTGNSVRDNHLRKDEYFDVQNYPKISIISKKVTASDKPGVFILTAMVNMKRVSKEISFPFTVVPQKEGMLFKGELKLNRRDFKVGSGSLILSDNLTISLSVFAVTQKK